MAKKQGIKQACKLLAENYEVVGIASDFEVVKKESLAEFKKAIRKGKLTKVKTYIAKGYDVNTTEDKGGTSPLFLAAGKADEDFFSQLLLKKADVNIQVKDGSTLLIAAVMGGNKNIVKAVLQKGIDVNAKGYGGNTALHVATMKFDDEMIKLLIAHGADGSIKNDKGVQASKVLEDLGLTVENLKIKANKKPQEKNLQKKKTQMSKSVPVQKSLEIAAKELNKNLPTMTDKEMRLERVTAEKSKMVYHFTLVHFTNWSMPFLKLKSLLYKDLKSQICNDNDSQMLLKKGVSIAYDYSDKDAKSIGTFSFDAKTCGLTTNVEQIKQNILNMIKK